MLIKFKVSEDFLFVTRRRIDLEKPNYDVD